MVSTHLKNICQNGNLPKEGKIENIWNQNLETKIPVGRWLFKLVYLWDASESILSSWMEPWKNLHDGSIPQAGLKTNAKYPIFCSRCLERNKQSSPKWCFNGDLSWKKGSHITWSCPRSAQPLGATSSTHGSLSTWMKSRSWSGAAWSSCSSTATYLFQTSSKSSPKMMQAYIWGSTCVNSASPFSCSSGLACKYSTELSFSEWWQRSPQLIQGSRRCMASRCRSPPDSDPPLPTRLPPTTCLKFYAHRGEAHEGGLLTWSLSRTGSWVPPSQWPPTRG